MVRSFSQNIPSRSTRMISPISAPSMNASCLLSMLFPLISLPMLPSMHGTSMRLRCVTAAMRRSHSMHTAKTRLIPMAHRIALSDCACTQSSIMLIEAGYRAQRYRCPLLFPEATGQTCEHEQFKKGPGCKKDINDEAGGRARVPLGSHPPTLPCRLHTTHLL